jgi:hypothetical protein
MNALNRNQSTRICLLTGLVFSTLCCCSVNRLEAQAAPSSIQSEEHARAASPSGPAGGESTQTLDQMLTQAMDRNPAIVTAKAKLALAQAELNAAQMEVSRQIVDLWNQQDTQQKAANLAIQQFRATDERYKNGTLGSDDPAYAAAKGAVIEAQAKLSKIHSELRSSIGQIPPAIQKSASASAPAARPLTTKASIQTPQGRLVNAFRKALDQKAQAEFTDTHQSTT